MSIFSVNMKRYRIQRGYTQEQVAEMLQINSQTVSRWECGTTLPDVLLLPEIAKLYAITVDDLFQNNNNVYRNYAERLAMVYQKTGSVDDFYQADCEYRRLMKTGTMDTWDMWSYGSLLDEMREFCTENALRWYDRVLEDEENADTYVYQRTRSLRAGLLISIGQGDEVIKEQEAKVSEQPYNAAEISFLMELYCRAGRLQEALELLQMAKKRKIVDWTIFFYGAEAYRLQKEYDKALELYRKCGEMGTDFHDDLEGMAKCYEAMGKEKEAVAAYQKLSSILQKEGYEEEAQIYAQKAEALM